MSKEIGQYNTDLHLFRENPKVKMKRLLFERWLAQNGSAEHLPESRPCGEFAMALVMITNLPIEEALRVTIMGEDKKKDTRLRDWIASEGDY